MIVHGHETWMTLTAKLCKILLRPHLALTLVRGKPSIENEGLINLDLANKGLHRGIFPILWCHRSGISLSSRIAVFSVRTVSALPYSCK